MDNYLDKIATTSQDYGMELSESMLENPELLYSSADANGPGFGIVSAGVALIGAAYLAKKSRNSNNVPNETEEFWKSTKEMNSDPNDMEDMLEE